MTRMILVVAAALALISFSPRHANASEAPWSRYTRGTKRARGTASIARSKSATPTRWQSVVFAIPARTTSARPTRTGSPKNVALARNKTGALRLH